MDIANNLIYDELKTTINIDKTKLNHYINQLNNQFTYNREGKCLLWKEDFNTPYNILKKLLIDNSELSTFSIQLKIKVCSQIIIEYIYNLNRLNKQ